MDAGDVGENNVVVIEGHGPGGSKGGNSGSRRREGRGRYGERGYGVAGK